MRAIINTRLEREAGLAMITKKRSRKDLRKAIFGVFFVIMGLFAGMTASMMSADMTYAVDEQSQTTETTEANVDSNEDEKVKSDEDDTKTNKGDGCKDSLGAIGWLVCPTTGKIAEAVDWLYEKLQNILTINPVSAEDGSPIYEIWKYCLGVTNILFVIFLLVVIYSQITGYGITNYGIKKTLPKLIMTAVLVNLSFLICSLAVDVSNVLGSGIRGLFTTVQESVMSGNGIDASTDLSYTGMFGALVGGGALTVGAAVIAFETGAIWMLIPMVLGAIVAVASGLITIALRQAVVMLLIMISPLAIVAYILPNTEQWFKKWRQLLARMLVFYPMFSLLFGAASLAGFAIIASATDGFGLILGTAVQIFPLFFSWSLMKMSGTFLGAVNAKMQGLAAKPLAANRGWAESHRQLSKQRHLASGRAYTPSLRLMQFMSNRRIARDDELSTHQETVKNRGLAYRASKNYNKKGVPTRRGERAYAEQAENMEYQSVIARDKNNFNKGFSYLATKGTAKYNRLYGLDMKNVDASDKLFAETTRGEMIEYNNAIDRHKRFEDAVNAHFDSLNGDKKDYKKHEMEDRAAAELRYKDLSKIAEGEVAGIHYAAASAAQAYDTQKKIVETKMQKYFELTPPTKDVEYRLSELTKSNKAIENIDSVISGLRILNQRGDTDLVREQLQNVLDQGVELGTHASQSLASFLMFEVKDSDPFLRRFGKYINLETAQVYNKSKRKNAILTLNEYVTGEYDELDPETNTVVKKVSKRPMSVLMEGTSLDNIERTAMKNLDDMLVGAYSDENGNLDVKKYLAQREKIETAIAPQFISASLKYLSGSEQLKSMVSFLTGYDGDGNARWEGDGDLAGDAKLAEEYFRGKTMKYLNDQTPTQILGLRSDYYNPLMEHLSKEYEESDMDGWDESAIEERRKYMAEMADIQTRYGDLSAEEAQERREKDMQNLKKDMAGAQFRQLLDSRGKLEQIYRTRRSGAANNAKDWVRGWLNLDDEISINKKLEDINVKRRREHKASGESDALGEENVVAGGFDKSDRAFFATRVREILDDWRNNNDNDVDVFYENSVEYVKESLDGVSGLILKKYSDYRENHPSADAYDLMEKLVGFIQDPGNY